MAQTAVDVSIGRRRWLVLGLGLAAQTSSCAFLYGIPFLVPAMRQVVDLSLAQVGLLVAAPNIGLLCTLIVWGAVADRHGERLIMASGLGLSGVLLAVAGLSAPQVTPLFVLFVLAGASTASVNAASGRVVLGWFGVAERGFAMGIRQTAQPLGVGIAALALPALAEQFGYRTALLLPAALAVVVAVLVGIFVADPPREHRTTGESEVRAVSPYRAPALWRLHGASALLVVPQFAVSAFAPVYLVTTQHWSPVAAGGFLAAVQALGAAGRLVAGRWSDRVASRLRPVRLLAIASTAVMLLVAIGDLGDSLLVAVMIALAGVITVSDNGLGFTAAAELAGGAWAGRAMGAQNTAQNLAAALTPPVLGLVIGDSRYGLAFGLAAVFPLLAVGLVPVPAESGVGRDREA